MELNRLGNIYGEEFGTGFAGNVWDTNGIAPTIQTAQGGGRQPLILQETGDDVIDKAIVAMRGRNPENPSDRTAGSPTEQRLEMNVSGTSNCLSTVQKDNLVMETIKIKQATKSGYIECETNGVADLSYPDSKTRRGRVQETGRICPTTTASETGIHKIETPVRIRKLTPKECFRLMGFDDSDIEAAEKVGVSNSQLYKQAGNSIVVDVLYYIYVELYKAMPYLFEDLKLSSFFSGIGAFEKALDRLYEEINSGKFTPAPH